MRDAEAPLPELEHVGVDRRRVIGVKVPIDVVIRREAGGRMIRMIVLRDVVTVVKVVVVVVVIDGITRVVCERTSVHNCLRLCQSHWLECVPRATRQLRARVI
nr:hypothetical protein [Kofleriaceae bacterium]